jgi:hypothetical protein
MGELQNRKSLGGKDLRATNNILGGGLILRISGI